MSIRVLVVGGAGYIGSHMVWLLMHNMIDVTVLDDLSSGHADAVFPAKLIVGSIGDPILVNKTFSEGNFDAVMHFASFIQVGESTINPSIYYQNNVTNTLALLDAMVNHSVKSLIFSSTAAVYGAPMDVTIREDHPKNPLSPYGRSKLFIEQILEDYDYAYGLKSICLRYFNAAGAHPDAILGERHLPETHLIPIAIKKAIAGESLIINGKDYDTEDGTCVRDYVHVMDIADAHLKALHYILRNSESQRFNIGNGAGHSITNIVDTVSKISNRLLKTTVGPRRDGDPSVLVASTDKIYDVLGWAPQYTDIETIIQHAWNWEQQDVDKNYIHPITPTT